jgi:hypothetical protein
MCYLVKYLADLRVILQKARIIQAIPGGAMGCRTKAYLFVIDISQLMV